MLGQVQVGQVRCSEVYRQVSLVWVRLGKFRLGAVKSTVRLIQLGQVKLGKLRLSAVKSAVRLVNSCQVRFRQVRLGQVRLGAVHSAFTDGRQLIFGPHFLHFSSIPTQFDTIEHQTNVPRDCIFRNTVELETLLRHVSVFLFLHSTHLYRFRRNSAQDSST